MKTTEVSIRGTASDSVNVRTKYNYDFPTTVAEAVETYGEEQTFTLIDAALTIAVQNYGRKAMVEYWEEMPETEREAIVVLPTTEGGSKYALLPDNFQQELQTLVDAWMPGQKTTRTRTVRPTDTVKAFMEIFGALSPERKAEILASLENRPSTPEEPTANVPIEPERPRRRA